MNPEPQNSPASLASTSDSSPLPSTVQPEPTTHNSTSPAAPTLASGLRTQDGPTAIVNLPSSTKASHRRNGNVARLPKAVRDQLNEMLLDGVPYRQIIKRLGEHGRSLSVNNISNWKTDGGFDEFLREQQRLKEC